MGIVHNKFVEYLKQNKGDTDQIVFQNLLRIKKEGDPILNYICKEITDNDEAEGIRKKAYNKLLEFMGEILHSNNQHLTKRLRAVNGVLKILYIYQSQVVIFLKKKMVISLLLLKRLV